MNRKIYLLIYGVHYEGSNVVGIYTDLNEAKRNFLMHVKDVDDVKISENGMSADNGCCYYMIDEREFKDNIKIESQIVFGKGNVGVATGFRKDKHTGKLVSLIQLSKLSIKGEIGKISKDYEKEKILSTIYFESLESLEVLQLALNKSREILKK